MSQGFTEEEALAIQKAKGDFARKYGATSDQMKKALGYREPVERKPNRKEKRRMEALARRRKS